MDAWLLRHFPGRFLEEIDTQMDWHRYMRAVAAAAAERIEDKRALQMSGKLKATDLDAATWEAIQLHDKLMGEE